ncbi:hypothetical protein Hanom_Chr03g00179471 [Helianthus anomalus]
MYNLSESFKVYATLIGSSFKLFFDKQKFFIVNPFDQWIRESRINKVVTFSTPVYKSLIKAFWNSASIVEIDGTEFIQGQVNEVNVNVSPEILNTVLELQDDPNAPYSIPILCTHGCLLRMKCTGDILSTQINKGDLPMRYKFLLHVLIQCLSNRRAGYDMACNDLACRSVFGGSITNQITCLYQTRSRVRNPCDDAKPKTYNNNAK